MPNYKIHYRSKQTKRKRRRTVQANSEAEARTLIETEATEIYEVTFVPEPLATERQIQMLRALGANPFPALTVLLASQQIGALLAEGREVDSAVFHANDPASERQLEYYRALGKKITPEIHRLSYNQMGILIEQAKAGGAIANYDIIDREKPATESQFYRLRQWGIDVTPQMEKMNKAEVKEIVRNEEDRRRKLHEQERDGRAEIHAKILRNLPTIDLSRVPYKTWAAAARAFKRKFVKLGADHQIDPGSGSSVSLFIETANDTEEEYYLGIDVFFEESNRLPDQLEVGVHPYQENGFAFPVNAVPRILPFPEGQYPTEQKYWAEFLHILTAPISSPLPSIIIAESIDPQKLVLSPPSKPEPAAKKNWWERLF